MAKFNKSAIAARLNGLQFGNASAATVKNRVFGESPLTSYYLLAASTALLSVVGLVMVLSSSTVTSISQGESPYAQFFQQGRFALIGVGAMLLAIKTPIRWIRKAAWPAFILAFILQALTFVPGIGLGKFGNYGWILLPVIGRMQPAEFGKVALAIWLGHMLGKRQAELGYFRAAYGPGLGAILLIGLVLGGRDLGTGLVILLLVFGAFFVAGIPAKLLAAAATGAGAVILYFVASSQNRRNRILAMFDPTCDVKAECYQALHGKYALASGGLFGVGLGGSREKWNYLPAAHNDFIYAIIGEELGLFGTIVVLALFLALGYAMSRVIRRFGDVTLLRASGAVGNAGGLDAVGGRSTKASRAVKKGKRARKPKPADPSQAAFVQITTAAIATWVMGQALINIGVVIGLFPVIGLPLPLVSAGGSALVTTMGALGMVINFARHEPGAAEALAVRPKVLRESLTVVAPFARKRAVTA